MTDTNWISAAAIVKVFTRFTAQLDTEYNVLCTTVIVTRVKKNDTFTQLGHHKL